MTLPSSIINSTPSPPEQSSTTAPSAVAALYRMRTVVRSVGHEPPTEVAATSAAARVSSSPPSFWRSSAQLSSSTSYSTAASGGTGTAPVDRPASPWALLAASLKLATSPRAIVTSPSFSPLGMSVRSSRPSTVVSPMTNCSASSPPRVLANSLPSSSRPTTWQVTRSPRAGRSLPLPRRRNDLTTEPSASSCRPCRWDRSSSSSSSSSMCTILASFLCVSTLLCRC